LGIKTLKGYELGGKAVSRERGERRQGGGGELEKWGEEKGNLVSNVNAWAWSINPR